MPFKYPYRDFSKHRTERSQKRRDSVKAPKAKEKAASSSVTQSTAAYSTASSAMPEKMEIDSSAALGSSLESCQEIAGSGKSQGEDELAAPYEIVEYEKTEKSPPTSKAEAVKASDHNTEKGSAQRTQTDRTSQTIQTTQVQVSQQEIDQLRELPEQMKALQSKFNELESEAQRFSPSHNEKAKPSETSELNSRDRRKLEKQIRDLTDEKARMEEQIHTLFGTQETTLKCQADTEARCREVYTNFQKESKTRDEVELNLRSEIAAIQGQYRKEKERAQKFMKAMAEMQSADPFKLDNSYFKSAVESLRYDIKNWARNQRLVLSPPTQNVISSMVNRVVAGSRERGPNYEFLASIVPNYFDYTESAIDFRYLLQAYVWKRLVELIWNADLWAGTHQAAGNGDNENQLPAGYQLMKARLEPDNHAAEEFIIQYHEWRSSSARILEKRTSKDRYERTIAQILDDIVEPLIVASEPIPQEIELDELESIIGNAMRLATSMAQQRAHFVFELIPLEAYNRTEFVPSMMTEPWQAEQFDRRTHMRVVSLMLAPRLLKYGTSEGTEFHTHMQLLEAEVETRKVPRAFKR